MRLFFRLFAFLLAAHVLGGCASFKKAQQRRRVAKAEAVLKQYQLDTPPAEQLADLIDRNPALEGKTVRIVKERDTIRIPGATLTVQLPAMSTPATDNALIDSLIAVAGVGFHAKDSATFAARLRAELAARPRLSRDTVTRQIGPITLKLWTDAHGRPQATVVKAVQDVAYEKTVHETGPILVKKELGIWERVTLFIKDAAGIIIALLVLIGGVWLWFYIKRQRAQQPTA